MNCYFCGKPGAIIVRLEKLPFCIEPENCRERFNSDKWTRENIPHGYRNTELQKLPCQVSTAALMSFDFWPEAPGSQPDLVNCGCYLHGVTGAGKTRSAFLFVKSLITGGQLRPSEIIWIRGSQFAREVVSRTKPGGDGGFDSWFSSLLRAELLTIDEVDKIKFSERVMSEFFELIEHRVSNQLPLILISNSSLDALCSRMSEESGPAIARRIKENLLPIRFTA